MKDDSKSLKQILIPTVIDSEEFGERAYDIYSRLLKDHIIFLGGAISREVANLVVAQLLFLDQLEDERDIYLYINSPGGGVQPGLAIFDTMNYVKADVHTICVGEAASMGAFLLANGAEGKRSMLAHAKVMLHQPWAESIGGQVTDIEITTKELLRDQEPAQQDPGRKDRPAAQGARGPARAGLLDGRQGSRQIRPRRQRFGKAPRSRGRRQKPLLALRNLPRTYCAGRRLQYSLPEKVRAGLCAFKTR